MSSNARASSLGGPLGALFPSCADLDVHKANIVDCARIDGPDGKVTRQMHTFPP
jgi:hypothetical protein